MPVGDIYTANALGVKPMSVQDYDTENLLMQAKRQGVQQIALALQEGQQKLQQAQNVLAQRTALTQAIQSGQIDLSNPDHAGKALAVAPDVAPGMLTTIGTYQKDQAQVVKDKGAGAKSQADATDRALQTYRGGLSMVRSPQDMAQWIQGMFSNPATAATAQQIAGTPQQAIARIPSDPKQFQQYLQQNAIGMDKYMADQTQRRGQDVSVANNTATNQAHLAGVSMTQAGENARSAASRATQLKLGGYDANGNLLDLGLGAAPAPAVAGGAPGAAPATTAQSPLAGMVDAIGGYKTPESVALGRVPPALKAQVLAAVMQKYPDYDPSTFGARGKAARDFSTGQQGNSLRSFAVAGQHLDQLGGLVDALGNGNLQIVNRIANGYAEQTGNPAPTNFDAAKDVVSKEVVKAIVAGGGGVAEREELSNLMSKAKSPAQLKGVITQYRGLMQAQQEALLDQRRASGLSDSTLPNYSMQGGAAAHPPDITNLLNKYAPGK